MIAVWNTLGIVFQVLILSVKKEKQTQPSFQFSIRCMKTTKRYSTPLLFLTNSKGKKNARKGPHSFFNKLKSEKGTMLKSSISFFNELVLEKLWSCREIKWLKH